MKLNIHIIYSYNRDDGMQCHVNVNVWNSVPENVVSFVHREFTLLTKIADVFRPSCVLSLDRNITLRPLTVTSRYGIMT